MAIQIIDGKPELRRVLNTCTEMEEHTPIKSTRQKTPQNDWISVSGMVYDDMGDETKIRWAILLS